MTFALPTPAAAGAFLLRNWLPVALGLALAIQTVRIEGFGVWPLKIVGLQQKYETTATKLANEHAGRLADRAAYKAAQDAAKAKNEAQVAKIEADQEKVSAEQKDSYQRDLARLRAGGVRQDLAAPVRPTRSAQAGVVPAPACRADDQNVLVDRKIVMQAAEIELSRNALIDWINAQAGVAR